MLRLSLFMIMLLASASASATTGLLPIDSNAMGADAARLRIAAVEVAKDVLRDRYVALDVDDAACVYSAPCIKQLIVRAGVEEAALVSVRPSSSAGSWAVVTVQMFDGEGALVFTATQALSTSRTSDLKGLMLQAFDPPRSFARVQFVGVGAHDELWIDNVVSTTTTTVRPGTHSARVGHDDGTVTVFAFTVDFDERKRVVVPTRTAEVRVVPAVVGAAAVVVGAAGATVGLVRLGQLSSRDGDERTITGIQTIGAAAIGVAGIVVVVAAVAPAFNAQFNEVTP